MTTRRSLLLAVVVALSALALPAITAQAGGWATVTLDRSLGQVRAGQMVEVGFVVKQHGQTPIHQAYGQAVEATLIADQAESKDRVVARATPDAPVGHFTARVTFPSAGLWNVEITPAPFAGTRLETVTVLTATDERLDTSAAAEASIAQAAPQQVAIAQSSGRTRDTRIALGLVAITLLAAGAAVARRRRPLWVR